MSYIILHPHSMSNPSGKYRVVKFEDWKKWNPESLKPIPCEWEFQTYSDAETKRDELNTPDTGDIDVILET